MKNQRENFIDHVKKINDNNLNLYLEQYKVKNNDRDARHHAPANKEWNNSLYAYNKNYLSSIGAKDQTAAMMIKSYFNLTIKSTKMIRSKRMRDLIRRSSTRELFSGKPEIKQNNDKVIITVYAFDREKVAYLKKLYMLNRWLNCNITNDKRISKERNRSDKFLLNRYDSSYLLKKGVFNKFRPLDFLMARSILKNGSKIHKVKHNFTLNTVQSLLKKKQHFTDMGFYSFLKWVLSLFNIQIEITSNIRSLKNTEITNMFLTFSKWKNGEKLDEKNILLKSKSNFDDLKKINLLLLQYLTVNVNSALGLKKNNIIYGLFKTFSSRHFNSIFRKHWKKEILIVKYLTKLYVSKFKFYNYLPGLKSVLNNIYDKKVQLNVVTLKYLHLNSDLFAEVISRKLRDRTKSLFGIMLKSFGVTTFKPNERYLLSEQRRNFIITNIETYFGRFNVINGNVMNVAFRKMFRHSSPINRLENNIRNTLISLRYKWITGLRLEAAGRLTKRYAAARAVFKYKRRGTLKNLEHLKNIENKLQSPSLFLLRGDVRPNIQYSFTPSKRRIGAFGLKSWISSS